MFDKHKKTKSFICGGFAVHKTYNSRYGVKDEPNPEGGEYGYDGIDIKREQQHGNEGGSGDYDEYERKPFNSNNGDGGYTY